MTKFPGHKMKKKKEWRKGEREKKGKELMDFSLISYSPHTIYMHKQISFSCGNSGLDHADEKGHNVICNFTRSIWSNNCIM